MITKEAGKNWIKYLMVEEYAEIFDRLNEIYENINAKIKERDPNIDDLVHNARMGMKDREYPKVLFNAWQIVESLEGIFEEVYKAYDLKNEMIKKYYKEHGGLAPYQIEQLREMHSKFTPKKASAPVELLRIGAIPDFELMSEAGVSSWIQERLPSFKGMKGAIFEKFLSNTVGKLRFGAQQALSLAEITRKDVKAMAAKLKKYRDDLMSFVNVCHEYQQKFETNKNTIANIYKEHFSEFLSTVEPQKTEIQKSPAWSQPAPVQPIPAAPAQQPQSIPDLEPLPPPTQPNVEVEEPNIEIDEDEEKTVPPTTASKKLLSLVKEAEQNLKEGNTAYAAYLFATASDICTDKTLSDKLFITAKSIENV
jgi:hypothetical protein